MITEPLDPFSEVVDERRKWNPEWYSWLKTFVSETIGSFAADPVEQGTWIPVITFPVLGDLSVAYSLQVGAYRKIGTLVWVRFDIATSTFTHTTASGTLLITGLPFQPITTQLTSTRTGALHFQGITKANYTQFTLAFQLSDPRIFIAAAGSGQVGDSVAAADVPSGGSVLLQGGGVYATD